MSADIVAMKRDVERSSPARDLRLARRNSRTQPAGKLDPAIRNSEKENRRTVAVAFGNGVGQLLNRSLYLACADRVMFGHEARLWRRANRR